jgi:2-polyprenyl-3-methyl-5-hydroxy-6-metoxy-1,4-benzoquinol methylase
MAEERFRPEAMRDQLIEAEHQARYQFAAAVVRGKRVLDAGCGVGWGSQVLLDNGAASVVGVDVDESAIRESAKRCPHGTFVLADLTDLPYPEQSFDVITCFEAIEHVEYPLKGIAEFRRVLEPGGLVFVSSPNPDVYPAGNPFHIHEFRPEELLTALRDRFDHTDLWRQQALIASALRKDAVEGAEPPVPTHRVALLADDAHVRDIYSLVVASDAPLPLIPEMVALVSSRQLDDLGAAAEAIMAERAAYAADHARIVEERALLLAEHAASNAEAVRLTEELARLASATEAEMARLADARASIEAAVERSAGQLDRARAERDRAWLSLLAAEQELARRQVSLP